MLLTGIDGPSGDEPFVNRYASCEIPPLEDFRTRLRAARFVNSDSYLIHRKLSGGEYVTLDIPVELIIGAPFISSWDLTDRSWDHTPEEYVWRLAHLIKEGRLRVSDIFDRVSLVGIDGIYFISNNGRHQTAALKGMIGENIVVNADVWRAKEIR